MMDRLKMHALHSGVFWMLIAGILFTGISVLVKLGTREASIEQAVFFRFAAGLPIVIGIILARKGNFIGKNHALLLVRSSFGLLSVFLFFTALKFIPIGNVAVLGATSPIFVALLSYWMVKESVSWKIAFLIPFFFLGVYLMVKPDPSVPLLPSLLALLAGLTSAIAHLSLRKLRETDRNLGIVFHFTVFSCIGSAPFALSNWNALSFNTLSYLFLAGALASFAQFCVTRAYQLEKASYVSLFRYFSTVWAYGAGLLFFDEVPTYLALFGAALIILCGLLAMTLKKEDIASHAVNFGTR